MTSLEDQIKKDREGNRGRYQQRDYKDRRHEVNNIIDFRKVLTIVMISQIGYYI